MTTSSIPAISVVGVTKIYPGVKPIEAVIDVDLSICAGETVAVEGPSGSGKSTLLGLMGLLDVPSHGVVRLAEMDASELSERRRSRIRSQTLGFVFQQFNLIGSLSAVANVETALLYRGISRSRRRNMAEEALERVGLGDRLTHRPSELSGGEQQRVSLSRAIVTNPHVVIADEPTGNLDSLSTHAVLALMSEFATEGIAIVVATHDPLVSEWADRRVHMRDGRLSSIP